MIQLSLVSYDERPNDWVDRKRIQLNSVFHLVTQGKLVYVLNNKEYHLEKGDFLYIPDGVERCGFPIPPYTHHKYVIRLSFEPSENILPILKNKQIIKTKAKRFHYIKQRLILCCEYWQEKDLYYTTLCQAIASEVLTLMNRDLQMDSLNKKLMFVRHIRDYIYENYQSPLTIEELAALVGKNSTYLITCFKNYYGVPPITYMHSLRISKAEELLLRTDMSIEDIAHELGYCDGSYFYRIFKRSTGLTPSTYRNQH